MFQKFGLKKLRMSLAELAHKRAQLSLRPNVPLTRQFAKDKKTSLSRSQSAPNLHWLDSAA